GMWDADFLRDVRFANDHVRAMFGIDEDAPVEAYYACIHKSDLERVRAAYADAIDPLRRSTCDVEFRISKCDSGALRWIHVKGRGVFDESGRCLRVAGTAIDITGRKTAELNLKDLNETLEAKVLARTATLEQTQAALHQAQKMEAIGKLTGGIA